MARNKFDIDEELETAFSAAHLKRILVYVKPYQKSIYITLFVILLANVATMIGPYLTKIVIDDTIPNKNITQLFWIAIIFIVSVVVTGLCMRYRIRSITLIGQDILKDMRTAIFGHLQKLPFSYFDSRPHGKILIRVVNYINMLSDLLSNGLINLISDILSVIVTLGFMLMIDPVLTLYSLALIPVLFVIVMVIKTAQRKAYQVLSNKQSNMNAYIHESIAGIKVTQSFSREEENFEIFTEVSNEYRRSWMKAVKIQFLLWPGVQNIAVMTTCLIYFVGIKGYGVDVSTGTLIAFIGYVGNFWNPVINIGNFYNSLITATTYLERIFETMDVEPDIKDVPNAKKMPPIVGNVDFKDVYFRYEEGVDILKGINFHVDAGESIALVGPTGAGKTTIINLLSRFYNINSGEILVDGENVEEVTLKSLRSQMGVMLQDTFIFSGTIIENIRYGKLDATEEEIIAAAKVVRAHDFISGLKDGYYTEVKERGSTLSAGQRQLISFARALLADPKILILDEATSSIDTQTEILLQEGLERLLEGRTSFIIAHRLSTIKNSSRIFYIDNGRIQEAGSHEELMAQHGYYYNLYQSQFDMLQAL
ncbi:ABC transporter ATP-binding protein [Listeria monocytogenes]|uniref:Putative drug efflux/lipid export ABC transporter, ATP-binding and permease protein n=1 Tax=Listeria monocytogenes serotype 4a (strain M7) TaxID=1030009 RepID=A0A0E0UT58_LISMM|nr:ABC transporter ATP-binding protein [Listeria monocytogenes]ACK40855.1 ABC transporter, ATP-binding/permease protein [Listeria monocytogenes HCC23]AEH91150.1 putative drug efflux/lipid export ABC transporter, ATP-binding and permease protein [Listeria monocytogenes M7]AKS52745.1 multidrug ABC transporter ATP-binding protein [Listeria monocytogenes]EAC6859888.1 ABC transporter ATP-binding protein [Listeria monocytogenes]EAD0182520.1 ABC transporter ATP-binding protein [Listeria monocytogenes